MSRQEFDTYLSRLEDESHGINLVPGHVPATKYLLEHDDGSYVGVFNLRHRLNEHLAHGAGHIGYGIAPSWRGHGYATEGLRLLLRLARERYGIEEAYLSVHKDNPASLAVQLHCGARIDHEDELEYYTRISTRDMTSWDARGPSTEYAGDGPRPYA